MCNSNVLILYRNLSTLSLVSVKESHRGKKPRCSAWVGWWLTLMYSKEPWRKLPRLLSKKARIHWIQQYFILRWRKRWYFGAYSGWFMSVYARRFMMTMFISEHIRFTGEPEGNDKDEIMQKIHLSIVKTWHFIYSQAMQRCAIHYLHYS